jgi:hypothetical protein
LGCNYRDPASAIVDATTLGAWIMLGYIPSMAEPDLADLRAIKTVLTALHPLKTVDQVKVLQWVIEKLEIGLDMKLALRRISAPANRSFIELAHERAAHGLHTPSEFIAEARPKSIVDGVLAMAVFLQLAAEDPDKSLLTGREINASLRNIGRAVTNITDCLNTLTKRNPSHIERHYLRGAEPQRNGYRVTEAGIDHVFKMMVFREDNEKA